MKFFVTTYNNTEKFSLNVSVLAKNQSCLLVRTFLHFAGFHKQPSLGLLRGLLYLDWEVCKPHSAPGIRLEITTFQKSLLYFLFFSFALFQEDKKSLLCPISHTHSIQRHKPNISYQRFNVRDFVASPQAFVVKAGIACGHWCPDIKTGHQC